MRLCVVNAKYNVTKMQKKHLVIGSPTRLLHLFQYIDVPADECIDPWGPRDDQCDVARYVREYVPQGLAALDYFIISIVVVSIGLFFSTFGFKIPYMSQQQHI